MFLLRHVVRFAQRETLPKRPFCFKAKKFPASLCFFYCVCSLHRLSLSLCLAPYQTKNSIRFKKIRSSNYDELLSPRSEIFLIWFLSFVSSSCYRFVYEFQHRIILVLNSYPNQTRLT